MTSPGFARTLGAMLRWDVRLQVRYGFYAVYAVLTGLYVALLTQLPARTTAPALSLVLVSDPAVLGFYFIAALVLVEKGEGVLDSLVVTPLGVDGYLLSKLASLTALALAASLAVAAIVRGGGFDIPLLVAGITLTSVFFVLLGFVAVARFDSINEYFLSAAAYGTVLYAPLLGFVGVVETPLFYLLPVRPALVLVHGAFAGVAPWETAYAVGYLSLGSVVAYVLARRSFRRHVVEGDAGGGRRASAPTTDRRRIEPRGRIAGLVLSDLRNWSRDPMLAFAAVGPFALALVARFGLPVIAAKGGVADVSRYFPLAAGGLALFGPYLYGFVVGIFMLEDREQNVIQALRVTPLTGRGYLLYRGASVYCLSVIGVVLPVLAFGLGAIPLRVLLPVAAVAALGGPAVSLLFASVARNTVEGLAINKLLSVGLVVPIAAIAAVREPLQFVAGALPPYWPAKALVAGTAGDPAFPAFLSAGVVAHAAVLRVLVKRFLRQMN